MERFTYIGSAYLVLIREEKILLARRCNTGFMDGMYGLPAGHMEGGETILEAGAREVREEIGIHIPTADLHLAHVIHRQAGDHERLDFFLTADSYSGNIENKEPEKCDDLSWFPLDSLPENTVPYIRQAIEAVQRGEFYSEFGWNQ